MSNAFIVYIKKLKEKLNKRKAEQQRELANKFTK